MEFMTDLEESNLFLMKLVEDDEAEYDKISKRKAMKELAIQTKID